MSPASSGSLEVERYIGACLISSHSRSKNNSSSTNSNGSTTGREVYYPREQQFMHEVYNNGYITYRPRRCNSVDGWAGGMPLISFANHQRRNRTESTRCPSPRVTEDSSNTPLSRLAVHTQGLPLILSGRHGNRRTKAATRNGLPQGRGIIDATKKIGDCKDNNVNGVDSLSVASDESSGSNNSETSLPRIIKPRKRRKKDRKPHPIRNSQLPTDAERHDVQYYFTPKSEPISDLSSETPQLHHRFEDIIANAEADDTTEPSSCQCRYCDPSGQIWDVDRHCYSPFLTTPIIQSSKYLSDKISSALQNQCLISGISLDEEISVKSDLKKVLPNRTQQCLEISTKIVTSPNGHRDLEIRLFSSSITDDQDNPFTFTPAESDNKLCLDCDQSLSPEE